MARTIWRAYQVTALNQYASVSILYEKLDVDLWRKTRELVQSDISVTYFWFAQASNNLLNYLTKLLNIVIQFTNVICKPILGGVIFTLVNRSCRSSISIGFSPEFELLSIISHRHDSSQDQYEWFIVSSHRIFGCASFVRLKFKLHCCIF